MSCDVSGFEDIGGRRMTGPRPSTLEDKVNDPEFLEAIHLEARRRIRAEQPECVTYAHACERFLLSEQVDA